MPWSRDLRSMVLLEQIERHNWSSEGGEDGAE